MLSQCDRTALLASLPHEQAWTPIGHGIDIALVHNGRRELAGLLERHPCRRADGSTVLSVGSIPFRGVGGWPAGYPSWAAMSISPLELLPSVRCPTCGRHGFITHSRWMPCRDDGHLPTRNTISQLP